MKFVWDERKAARNEHLHHISFNLAENFLRSGLGVPVEEQWRSGEWRTKFIVPAPGGLLFSIVVADENQQGDEDDTGSYQQAEDSEDGHDAEHRVRIISARQASSREELLYLQADRPDWT